MIVRVAPKSRPALSIPGPTSGAVAIHWVSMVRHIVALSGGKDSTAVACRLRELHPDIDFEWVCTPTGDELPGMLDHWLGLGRYLGKPILPVTGGTSLSGLIRKWDALPNHRQRWCTRVLKLDPYYRWLAEQAPAISYVGLRADEESRAGMEFPDGEGIEVRFPMQDWGWGLDDVWAYLGSIPGHTGETMADDIPSRTDCARCYHQTLFEWWSLWSEHPELFKSAAQEENTVSLIRGRDYTFRSPQRDTWPARLDDLAREFASGRVPKQRKRASMCRVCTL